MESLKDVVELVWAATRLFLTFVSGIIWEWVKSRFQKLDNKVRDC